MKHRLAIVTGGNRGLGLETCRQLAQQEIQVILTCRDADKGEAAAKALAESGLPVMFQRVDVTDTDSIRDLAQFVGEKYGWLDVLVNNAGIMPEEGTLDAPVESLREAMDVNAFGAFQMCQLAVPLMERAGYGRIVNVSSGMGQLSEMNGGHPAYRLSKAALNAVTRIFSEEAKGTNILVNSVCPGWVRTDMGGASAGRNVEQGASGIVWAATLPDDGPTGGFFRDGKPMAW